jgi:phosphoribosylanthranilate isomerase
MKVKICGITNLDDALAACDAGADALGFVFAPEAKARNRYVDPEQARRICDQLPPFVSTVAVCVNEPLDRLVEYLEFLDWVQLCGEETIKEYAAVAPRAIKVIHIPPSPIPKPQTPNPKPQFPTLLLDASMCGAHGGTGKTCDWDAARGIVADAGRPVILAGGLTPENVAEAVRRVQPYGVDTSGGVEHAPGKKDHDKIRAFIRNARLPVS